MSFYSDCLLGIDLGTTNIKGIIISSDGTVLARASQPCTTYEPAPLCVEQKAEEWWTSCRSILQSLTSQAGPDAVSAIKGISISSHVISMLAVDEKGAPLRNALIYQDNRSAAEVDEIVNKVGKEKYVSLVASQPSVAFLPNKILWFKRNEPELFARTRCFLQASGYLNFKLTGVFNLDEDCAYRTQCFDVNTMEVSSEIAEAVGADLASLLPKPSKCTDIIGCVTKEAALETGLAEGTPVIAGASDAMASVYATGMSRLGEAGESSGTTSLVFAGAPSMSALDVPVVARPCNIKGMPYLYDAPIGASGASLKWFLGSIGFNKTVEGDPYKLLNDTALEAPAGSNKVIFFPYLVAGERAPLWNSHARGMFMGMTIQTKNSDIARSIFEGTGFALRHVMQCIKEAGGSAESLRVTGGGSKSRVWNMIKASMLHMPVYMLDENGGDVPFGDCLLAGSATGVFGDLTEAISGLINVTEQIDPVPEWEKVYDDMFPYYVEFYQKVDDTLHRFAEL